MGSASGSAAALPVSSISMDEVALPQSTQSPMGTDAGPQICPSKQTYKLVGGRRITHFEQEWGEQKGCNMKSILKSEPFVLCEGIAHSCPAPTVSLLQDQGHS